MDEISQYFLHLKEFTIYLINCFFYTGSGTIDKSWNKRLCLRLNLSSPRGLNRLLKYYIDQVIKPCKENRDICVERVCPNASCLRSLANLPTNCDYVYFLYLFLYKF